jgi:tetratricopeptide (TPR) repeat protein
MEESFLSRVDSLDSRVRKVLQTCAILGLEFALTDVIQVHPEMAEIEIENALDLAVDEMILVEHSKDDDETISLKSISLSEDEHTFSSHSKTSRSHSRNTLDDRYFQFSHAMWRNNVLATMLKERKYELHRLIAETMEGDKVLVLEQSNISRLLTIFEHWKACGDFCKAAPLALAVGARLEEWDLSAQSLELYEDALELSFESIFNAEEEKDPDSEWIQVKAKPMVLDLILRLHICVGLCHQRLGDPEESIFFFEDAYSIIKSASKIPGMSKALMMPIISSLCVLKLDAHESEYPNDLAEEQATLIETLLYEANNNGHPVHICRALSIKASHEARLCNFEQSNGCVDTILSIYDIASHSSDMVAEYGCDFALVSVAESVQWLYLSQEQEQAELRADYIMDELLPQVDGMDIDDTMLIILPVISVLMLVDRSKDADWLLKKYIINPYHESGQVSFWSPVFNPLAYVLELILMEESEQYDTDILEDLEAWVMDEESSNYDIELERRAHTLMGELCWRLAYTKEQGDPERRALLDRAAELLTPIANYPHPDIFLRHTARALLEAM